MQTTIEIFALLAGLAVLVVLVLVSLRADPPPRWRPTDDGLPVGNYHHGDDDFGNGSDNSHA